MNAKLKTWAVNSLIALDQFVNAFVFFGYPDETISSRLGRAAPKCIACRGLCWILSKIFHSPDHCRQAEQSEVTGNQLPPDLVQERDHVDVSGNGKD